MHSLSLFQRLIIIWRLVKCLIVYQSENMNNSLGKNKSPQPTEPTENNVMTTNGTTIKNLENRGENIRLECFSKVDAELEIDCPFGDCSVKVSQENGKLKISCAYVSYEKYEKEVRCTKIYGICRLKICFEEYNYIPILPP